MPRVLIEIHHAKVSPVAKLSIALQLCPVIVSFGMSTTLSSKELFMGTTRFGLFAAAVTLTACLTEETSCPAHHERMRGLCVPIEESEDAGPETVDQLDASTIEDATVLDVGSFDAAADAGDASSADASDSAVAPVLCYLDYDRDGVGSGTAVPCPMVDAQVSDATVDAAQLSDAASDSGLFDSAPADAAIGDAGDAMAMAPVDAALPPAISHRNDDCDDHNAERSPIHKELCDGIDNDCNDQVDDNAHNACGGSCERILVHAPGETCDNGQRGNCTRTGRYVCQGENDTVCNAPTITPSSELCSDNIDNDCDGATDEPDGINAPTWYQDCDGDGYAITTTGSQQSCTKPANNGSCGWTAIVPVPPPVAQPPTPSNHSNWDCNDGSQLYKPEAGFAVPTGSFTSWDFNCDGLLTPDPAPNRTQGSGIYVCADSIIANLNNNHRECSPTNDGTWNHCYFWVGSNGIYTNTPPSQCPDNNGRQLDVREGVVDPWGLNLSTLRHATTCAAPRRPLGGRARAPHAESTLTTPGAWVCTVLTVGPIWPCR